jgi:hypothetical protein
MTDRKLCGRITDHDPHYWVGQAHTGLFDADGYLHRLEWRCPGRVVIEGGQRSRHPKENL